MFLMLAAVVLGLLLALLRGGKLRRLAALGFHGAPLIFLAFALQVAGVLPFWTQPLNQSGLFGLAWGSWLYLLSLTLLVYVLARNWRLPGLPLIALGFGLNLLVVAANGGQIPVAPDRLAETGELAAARTAVETGHWQRYTFLDDQSRLWFLGDVIPIPRPWPKPVVASVGDLLLIVGVFWFFQGVLCGPRRDRARPEDRAPEPPVGSPQTETGRP